MDHLTDYARWMENVPFGSDISDLDAMILCRSPGKLGAVVGF